MTHFRMADEVARAIFQSLTEAEINFDLWEGLREGRSDRETVRALQPYAAFFSGAENALFDSFILILYAVYETRRDTVSITALLKAVEATVLTAPLEVFKARAKALKPAWVKVGILRNEAVGHQALNTIPARVFENAAISPQAIRELLKDSQRLLADIALEAFKIKMVFNARSKPHLDRLLADLRSNTSSNPAPLPRTD